MTPIAPAGAAYTDGASFFVDSAYAYWSNAAHTGVDKAPLSGSMVITPVVHQGNAYAFTLNMSNVFWCDGNASVWFAPLGGGATTTITTSSLPPYR